MRYLIIRVINISNIVRNRLGQIHVSNVNQLYLMKKEGSSTTSEKKK